MKNNHTATFSFLSIGENGPIGARENEGGADLGDPGPDLGHWTQCRFLTPQRHVAMAWRRRRQDMGTLSSWERP